MELVLATFAEAGPDLSGSGVRAVGHRVVMGGRDFDAPSLVDDAVLDAIERLSPLAPLHNPANLATIRVALELLAEVPHRSEEHTSELQSLMRISYAVFCLQKKKKTTN